MHNFGLQLRTFWEVSLKWFLFGYWPYQAAKFEKNAEKFYKNVYRSTDTQTHAYHTHVYTHTHTHTHTHRERERQREWERDQQQ